MHADLELARRIDKTFLKVAEWTGTAAESVDDCLSPAFCDFGGFGAMFCGDGSPLTQTSALNHDVELSPARYAEIESFYKGRANSWEMHLGPFSHEGSWKLLQEKGWRVVGHENTHVLNLCLREPLGAQAPTETRLVAGDGRSSGLEVMVVSDENRELWARTITEGFFDNFSRDALKIAEILSATRSTISLMVTIDGVPAGGAGLIVNGDTALLGGMSTIKRFRGRGVQTILVQERVRLAAEHGCDLVTVETTPGSASQRNMERQGFRVAWTKTQLALIS